MISVLLFHFSSPHSHRDTPRFCPYSLHSYTIPYIPSIILHFYTIFHIPCILTMVPHIPVQLLTLLALLAFPSRFPAFPPPHSLHSHPDSLHSHPYFRHPDPHSPHSPHSVPRFPIPALADSRNLLFKS